MSKNDAKLVCRFGGIHDRKQDCIEILKSSFLDSGWALTTIKNAGSFCDQNPSMESKVCSITFRHVELAQKFASWVQADKAFELAAPTPLNLVCFRHRGGDEITQSIMDRVNRSGELYLTHTKLDGKFILRMSIGQTNTESRHVENSRSC